MLLVRQDQLVLVLQVQQDPLEELDRLAEQERDKYNRRRDSRDVAPADDEEMLLGPDVAAGVTTAMSARQVGDEEFSNSSDTQTLQASRTQALNAIDDLPPVPRKKRTSQEAIIDLTPAVDVTFQLLIFFMITASFSLQKAFDVPPAKNSEGISMNVQVEMPDSGVRVEVDRDNMVFIGDKKAQTYKEILELLTAEKSANSSVRLCTKACNVFLWFRIFIFFASCYKDHHCK